MLSWVVKEHDGEYVVGYQYYDDDAGEGTFHPVCTCREKAAALMIKDALVAQCTPEDYLEWKEEIA